MIQAQLLFFIRLGNMQWSEDASTSIKSDSNFIA